MVNFEAWWHGRNMVDSANKVTGHSTAQEMRAASDDQMQTNIKCNRGPECRKCLKLSHAPDTARTCNLQFRRLSLYPVELRVLFAEPLTIGHNIILARRN
jgi:hypothetical protein